MARGIPKGLFRKLGKEGARFFGNCGRLRINGNVFTDTGEVESTLRSTKYLYDNHAEVILENMRSLNAVMESLQIGLQYDPENLKDKCPELIVEIDISSFHCGVKWW